MLKPGFSTRAIKLVGAVLTSLMLTVSAPASGQSVDLTTDARNFVAWVLHSGDHQNLPFIVVDKQAARIFVYGGDGTLQGAGAALLGIAVGDDSAPGIGEKRLADIARQDRTTPAGRFVADLGRDIKNAELLWIDYDTALSLHVVITSNVAERREERLASDLATDLRITYGCINVAERFYHDVVFPNFQGTSGIVYILPEVHSIEQVFGYEAARFAQR